MAESVTGNPYIGPRSFERSKRDQDRFFGRDAETEELVSFILGHGLVLVYAQSGAGKTSLFNARVIPRLTDDYRFQVPPLARVQGILPEGEDFREIGNLYVFNVLRSMAPEADPLALRDSSLAQFLRDLPRDWDTDEERPVPRALILDQFEELFMLYPEHWEEQQKEFFTQLREALDDDPLLRIVLVLREDYLARLDPFAQQLPEGLRIRFRLECLRQDQALDAIRKPLRAVGREFADGVAERLVQELSRIRTAGPVAEGWVEGVYVEPVQLQVVCGRLWESLASETRVIGFPDLAQLDVNRALADFYELILHDTVKAIGVREFRLRKWFSESLITPLGTRGTVLKGQENTGGIPNEAVELLARRHLIRAEYRSGASWFELAHDRFIEPILSSNRAWLEGKEEIDHACRSLEQKAAEWVRLGRGEGGLLDEVELLEAGRWLANPNFRELDPSPEIHALVRLSRDRIELARREKEDAQRRELEQARTLAEEQRRRAVEHAQSARRFRNLAVAFAAVSLLAAGASLYGWLKRDEVIQGEVARQEALQEARIASLRRLITSAVNHLDSDPERSLLLALHAAEASRGKGEVVAREAADALEHALHASRVRWTWRTEASLPARVAYNQDGTRLAAKQGARAVRIWNAQERSPLFDLLGHEDVVTDIAFAPDGGPIATTGADQTARIWDGGSGEELHRLPHESWVSGAAFSPDGKILATVEQNGRLRLWEVASGKPLPVLSGVKQAWATDVAFSHDGKFLAVADQLGAVRVWTVSSGQERFAPLHHDGVVSSVRFSPDGQLLLTASEDKSARLWDAATGKELRTLPGHTNSVFEAEFSPDGTRVVTGSADTTARIYDSSSGRPLIVLAGHGEPIESVAFHPSGTEIATAGWDGTLRVWDVSGHTDVIHTVVFSEDGRRIATAAADGSSNVWAADSGQVLLQGQVGRSSRIALSPDGRHLALGDREGTVHLWDADSGRKLAANRGVAARITRIRFNAQGDRLASASADGTVVLQEASDAKVLRTLSLGYEPTALAFGPDGRQLATGDASGLVTLWDTETGESRELRGHTQQILQINFSPDGGHVATASQDGSARLWALSSPKGGTSHLLEHEGIVFDAQFSRDGARLVTASMDRTAKLWEVAEGGRLLATLRGHGGAVERAVFSADGKRVATASWDWTARVWESAAEAGNIWKSVLTLYHGHEVNGLGFSADGQRLTTVSADGKVRVHFFDLERMKALARTRVTRSLTTEECQEYLDRETCP